MRIVVISFYYPPDLSAGSFRTGALVARLLHQLGPGDSIRVLTTAPNRYASFQEAASAVERHDRLTIERIPLSHHESGFKDQLRSFFGFAREVLGRVRAERADVVYATSSRLGTAALGALVARRCRAKLHLDIRDLFVANMGDMLRGPLRAALPVLGLVERLTFRAANQISVVSPGFNKHISATGAKASPVLRTNGIDDEFIGGDFAGGGGEPPLILYAGNIGDGQGLSQVVPEAAARLHGKFRFRIIGDGGRRSELVAELGRVETQVGHKLDVQLLPPMKRTQLIEQYANADILLVHLNDYPAFRLVIPSKLFEYGATGKPIIAGISGVAGDFVRQHIGNAAVFDPCSVNGMIDALSRITMQLTDRSDFVASFSRQAILDRLAADIIELGRRQTA